MSGPRIAIDVKRSDGDVTRLEGTAGLAVSCSIPRDAAEFTEETDTPFVSLRACSRHQLSVMLGALIASIEAAAPGTTAEAVELSALMNARKPAAHRDIPWRGGRSS